jgi:ABC-type proline/glycine betaine transport system substrate-binding protein
MVTYLVRVRAEVARRIQAAAAREGASPEAVAALWLEEHAEEVPRTHRAGPTPPDPP